MKGDPPQLLIIEQLSREYDEKYRNLEKLVSESTTEEIPPQLMGLAERAADRFRSAQATLLSLPATFEEDAVHTALPAMTALFRAFDEMRILFQFLFETINSESEYKESSEE
ncbi:MAG: hypothetical protein P4L55_10730 [Syntrophobacteraceae bacterium]|nr:hypothetical protein [Syntrophobacteraceae bacterium]